MGRLPWWISICLSRDLSGARGTSMQNPQHKCSAVEACIESWRNSETTVNGVRQKPTQVTSDDVIQLN
jgi:hypothetical protein